MNETRLSGNESKLLSCLLLFFREIGPGATPGLTGLDDEAGLDRHELDKAVKGLRDKGDRRPRGLFRLDHVAW